MKKIETWRCIIAGSVGVLVIITALGMRQLLTAESTDQTHTTATDASPADAEPAAETPARPDDSRIARAIEGPVQINLPEAGLSETPDVAASRPADEPDDGATATPAAAPMEQEAVTGIAQKLDPAPVDSKDLPLGPLVSPSVLVDKSALRLTVFDGDAGMKSYRVAVGAMHGDKEREGDRRTPEGDFYICIRKPKDKTPYTRSLGLSYPNIEDADRGVRDGLITAAQRRAITEAITNGRKPPWKTKLGGAIMIHGKREGRTGTLGCIALDDDDIIELYNRLPIKTPVRIVP